MAKFKDFSEYKNNTLKYYFFQKALKNYALEKEKQEGEKSKVGDNLIFSTLFTYLISETDYLTTLKNNCLLLYLLIVILFYLAMMAVYYLGIFPMYKGMKTRYENWKFNRTANPDNLRSAEQKTTQAYLNKFNHEISDQIAIAIDITSRIKEDSNLKLENHFYIGEAFESIQTATSQLFMLLGSQDFRLKQGDDYKIINKHRITELVPLIEKITSKIDDYWTNYNCVEEHTKELNHHKDNVRLIKEILEMNPISQ